MEARAYHEDDLIAEFDAGSKAAEEKYGFPVDFD